MLQQVLRFGVMAAEDQCVQAASSRRANNGKTTQTAEISWRPYGTLTLSTLIPLNAKSLIALSRFVKTFWSCWTVCHQVFRWIAIFPTLVKEIPNSSEGMQWHARLSTCVSICASIVDFELSLSGLNPFEETTSGLFIWFTWFQMRQAWSSAKNRKRWVKWAFKHFQALMGSGLASQASVICLWLSSFYVFFFPRSPTIQSNFAAQVSSIPVINALDDYAYLTCKGSS